MAKDTGSVSGVSAGRLVAAYVKIRDTRAKRKAEFEEEDGKLREQQDKIGDALLAICKEQDADSMRTENGTFYRTVRRRYWTSDWDAMHKFVLEHEVPDFLEKRLNQTVVREFLEEHPEEVPPGLNVEAKYTISVRKK